MDALILSMTSKKLKSVYNVASGTSLSVKEIIESIQTTYQTTKPTHSSNHLRPSEISDTVGDISLIKEELGWTPKYSFNEGMKDFIQ